MYYSCRKENKVINVLAYRLNLLTAFGSLSVSTNVFDFTHFFLQIFVGDVS